MLSFGVTNAAAAFTASCAGVPASTNIIWTASSSGGIAPVTYLWGNGSTATVQTVSVSPGTYTMTLAATDASTTVATATCSATIAAPVVLPSITSFAATPSAITVGQSAVLSWVVANASSTSLDNGVGAILGASVTVTPTVTTTYHLSVVNPNGTVTGSATVTVNAPSSTGGNIYTRIHDLLNQIAALKAQIAGLLVEQRPGGTATSTVATTSVVTCFNFDRDLRNGDRGDDVKQLQRILASDPSIFPPGSITGFFGHRTEAAMKQYQRKFGIFTSASTTTGFVGPMTRKHLNAYCKAQWKEERKEEKDEKSNKNNNSNVSVSSSSSSSVGERGKSEKSMGHGGNGSNNGKGNGHGGNGKGHSSDD